MGELMPTVAKVWIEEDCITCDACEDILPEVFEVTDDTSQIKPEVREDGSFDRNIGFSSIKAEFRIEYSELIEEAADACPVEIIKFEYEGTVAEEVKEEITPVAAEVVAVPVAVADAGTDDPPFRRVHKMGFDANVEFLRIAFWQIIIAAGPLLAVARADTEGTKHLHACMDC